MKSIKLCLLAAVAAAICYSQTFAGEGDKPCSEQKDRKEHKCGDAAQPAGKNCEKTSGKTCDKGAPKDESKK